MLKVTAFVLIALIKTPGEGGTVQIETENLEECRAMGKQIKNEFGDMHAGNGVHVRVFWACIERREN